MDNIDNEMVSVEVDENEAVEVEEVDEDEIISVEGDTVEVKETRMRVKEL